MQLLHTLITIIRDPGAIITWGGLPALGLIVFLETGLLVFFLPGDSLLVVAGFYAAKGLLNIVTLNLVLAPLAILGDACAYSIGKRLGKNALEKGHGKLLSRKNLGAAEAFYAEHGGKAIVLARFAPLVRSFVPVVAGIAGMPYREFLRYNIIGGFGWVSSMSLIGYFLGTRFPFLLDHLEKVILVVVLLSMMPPIWETIKAHRADAKR